MYKGVWFLIVVLVLSCAGDDSNEPIFDEDAFPQKWELKEMFFGFPNGAVDGDDMDWQEFFILNEDDSFLKTRDTKGVIELGSGTYQFNIVEGKKHLTLEYANGVELIENCIGGNTETLHLSSPNTLTGGSAPCDGPGLYYERVE